MLLHMLILSAFWPVWVEIARTAGSLMEGERDGA